MIIFFDIPTQNANVYFGKDFTTLRVGFISSLIVFFSPPYELVPEFAIELLGVPPNQVIFLKLQLINLPEKSLGLNN